jgi:hypothetical protein
VARTEFIAAIFDVSLPSLSTLSFNLNPREMSDLGFGRVQFTVRASGVHDGKPFALAPFAPVSGGALHLLFAIPRHLSVCLLRA